MNLVPAVWLFAALSALATALSWFLPACRKNYLPAKMTCSSLFLLTALFAAVSYGEVTDYSVYIIVALIFRADRRLLSRIQASQILCLRCCGVCSGSPALYLLLRAPRAACA